MSLTVLESESTYVEGCKESARIAKIDAAKGKGKFKVG